MLGEMPARATHRAMLGEMHAAGSAEPCSAAFRTVRPQSPPSRETRRCACRSGAAALADHGSALPGVRARSIMRALPRGACATDNACVASGCVRVPTVRAPIRDVRTPDAGVPRHTQAAGSAEPCSAAFRTVRPHSPPSRETRRCACRSGAAALADHGSALPPACAPQPCVRFPGVRARSMLCVPVRRRCARRSWIGATRGACAIDNACIAPGCVRVPTGRALPGVRAPIRDVCERRMQACPGTRRLLVAPSHARRHFTPCDHIRRHRAKRGAVRAGLAPLRSPIMDRRYPGCVRDR